MQQTRKDPLTAAELPTTLALLTEWAAERYSELPALRFRRDGAWTELSYVGLRDRARQVGRALLALGVRPGDRVAILAETRPEWTHAHFGALAAGAVVVPVYPTAGDEEVTWVVTDSGATVILCEDARQAAKVERLRGEGRLKGLREVALLTAPDPADTAAEGAAVGRWMVLGAQDAQRPVEGAAALDVLLERAAARGEDDLATIIYTSGTTGAPKGCLLTHGNLLAVQRASVPLVGGGPGDSTYLYLPLAHLLAQLIEFTTLLQGGTLTFFGGRIEDVVGELAQARPTHLPSVPRLFEKVRSVVLSLAEAQEGGRERFEEAVRIGVMAADGTLPPDLQDAYEAADKALYGLVRQALGGRVRWALTGGAPIAPDTVDFLRACGIAVYEGYGMTESAGVLTLNHPGAVRHGTVGRPVDGVELRIAADGEVLARGPMVFPGYHNNPEATRETVDAEGWLHTGDLGALDDDGYLTITGRKKELIITSAGKNLTPSLSELAVQNSRFVSRAVMVGDRRPHPVALITLDTEEVTGWAAREGVELTEPLSRDPRVRALVQEAVDTANATVSRPARIRRFAVLDEDFTVEEGLLTPSLKVRRRAVTERYAHVVDALYEEGPL
ncbi:long-chain fatty acid--CoA ligase [Streptomyces sp. WAC 01529]|uniref:AMP-dependent synthetase/ligase n=1 Tax=Streptomyces sp. WAC 01529 TaxID=2203205 RepID=UPI000F70E4F8|nr:long-chain fatty acid--CoA ligase [Streptomyces sp. WAC 01529]AZM54772.1 long-chain fatty acid--CoA ligase [Streptomyces sp. WAC 01529]